MKRSDNRAADFAEKDKTQHLYFRNRKQHFAQLAQAGLPATPVKAKTFTLAHLFSQHISFRKRNDFQYLSIVCVISLTTTSE